MGRAPLPAADPLVGLLGRMEEPVWLRLGCPVGQLFKLRTRFHRVQPAEWPALRAGLSSLGRVTMVRLTHSGFTSESARAGYRGWPQVLGGLQAYVGQQF